MRQACAVGDYSDSENGLLFRETQGQLIGIGIWKN